MLQIHLIAFDDIVWVLGPPPCHHPAHRTYTSYNTHPILLAMLHWPPFKPITLFVKLFPLNIWNVVYATTLSVRWRSPYNMPWRHRRRPDTWLHSLLILALDVGGWSTQFPSCFTLRKSPDTYFSRLGGPQDQSEWVLVKRNPLPLSGIEPWTVKPVASHYTNYVVLAPSKLSILQTIQWGSSFTQALEATLRKAT